MELKIKTALALVFALTLLSFSCLVRSRTLLTAPSPAPEGEGNGGHKGVVGRKHMRKGSFPGDCDSKCNQCKPCKLVQVSVRSMNLVENNIEYYPQVWRCMCHHNIFFP
ncbi:EPIDERMAL PATTERNING FACTOR-like protein 4, partial [Cucurbita argyrosperma subsp. argyrosperma]